MITADYVWAGIIAAGVAFETYTLRNAREADTLSETTRRWFHVRTSKAGRLTFLAGWLGFAAWYAGHILEWWA